VGTLPVIERKGGVPSYTSQNDHMFIYLDQTGTLGIQLPKDDLEAFLKLLGNTEELKKYLEKSYE
jgi:hypothetical protein